jgi:hypothetical protein
MGAKLSHLSNRKRKNIMSGRADSRIHMDSVREVVTVYADVVIKEDGREKPISVAWVEGESEF